MLRGGEKRKPEATGGGVGRGDGDKKGDKK